MSSGAMSQGLHSFCSPPPLNPCLPHSSVHSPLTLSMHLLLSSTQLKTLLFSLHTSLLIPLIPLNIPLNILLIPFNSVCVLVAVESVFVVVESVFCGCRDCWWPSDV